MDHHGRSGRINCCGNFIETTGCSRLISLSLRHVVFTPVFIKKKTAAVICLFLVVIITENVSSLHFLIVHKTKTIFKNDSSKLHCLSLQIQIMSWNTWSGFIWTWWLWSSISFRTIQFISILIHTPANTSLTLYWLVFPIICTFWLKLPGPARCLKSV